MKYCFTKNRTIVNILILIASCCVGQTNAQTYKTPVNDRQKLDISAASWKFLRSNSQTGAEAFGFNDAAWTNVTIPHTWNTKSDRTANSNCWYRTHFTSSTSDSIGGKRFYLFFEGANDNADVYLNGTLLGTHNGGYTRFIFDGTKARKDGDNVLAVKVDNQNHPGLPSNGNGWLHFGGMHRKVWILKTNKYNIDPTDFASSGVYISQNNVSATSASISIKTMLKNYDAINTTFTVKNIICDSNNTVLKTFTSDVIVNANSGTNVVTTGSITNPILWNFGNSYLYKIYTEVLVDNIVKDVVYERTGFRYYTLTTSNFTLNGSQKLLRGACLHAENEYKGLAIDSTIIHSQFDVIQDMGMNFIRLVHYPHAQITYDMADERGIGLMTETGLYQNSVDVGSTIRDNNCREMVKQNFNHPSILFWCAGNEDFIDANTQRFAPIIKATDNSRPVAYASSGQNPTGVDFVFSNIYQGWYSGAIQDFPASKNWISESGAGGVITSHQDYKSLVWTVNTWEPDEYSCLVNEYKYEYIFNSNPTKVPFYTHWLLFDISDYKYKDLNTKGMFTYAGLAKDHAYLWKAKAKPTTPLVWITGKNWYLRSTVRSIKVYANRPSLTLFVNGVNKGSKLNGAYTHPSGGSVIHDVFLFDNMLDKGKNIVIATDGAGIADTAIIYFTGTAPAAPADSFELVTGLTSSNTNNPAYFINRPIKPQSSVYYQCDGNADNSFDSIPSIITNASLIATKRQSISGNTTSLSFKINASLNSDADIFIMCTQQGTTPAWITAAGFTNTGINGFWRDNSMTLVKYQLYKKSFPSGATVSIGSSAIDFVVLVKNKDLTSISNSQKERLPQSNKPKIISNFIHNQQQSINILFGKASYISLYDFSGKCICAKLTKNEYMEFVKHLKTSRTLYIVKTIK